ncbi:hypothetical protein ONZ45_g1826 [Pleurotus djamor]|nr:hypothetical protein ONZ45_g1826 [Pleurotus djamor]
MTTYGTGGMANGMVIFLLYALSIPGFVFSRPTSLAVRQELPPQLDVQPNQNDGSSRKIWIPITVIALALSAFAILVWCRRYIWKALTGIAGASGATRIASRTGPGVREVTAEQLAGSLRNNNAAGNTTTTGTTGRPRRTRRPRRTPSQISTTSLPAYMKEPGEEELVIYRGPEDMEDNPMPPTTNVVMPPVDEDMNESVHSHSRNASQASSYPPAPESPNDMPLLSHDEENDDTSSPGLLRSPPGDGMPTRPSTETLNTSEGPTSLMPVPTRTTEPDAHVDPRGAAPPYFEVVDLNESQRDLANSPSTVSDPSEPRTPPSSSGSPGPRRSAFMSLWHSIGGSASASASQSPPGTADGLPTHMRTESAMSNSSSSNSHGNTPPRTSTSRFSHRPTLSNGSSILSPFRTLSRQKSTTFSTRSVHSTNNLNSPSLISLNSISSPLTHTAVRTEFAYPKAGPTPEQMKLISSRESFVRFGKPYGPDAVSFAASTSRMDLSPPPDFEEVNSETNLIGSSGGPSRTRSDSRLASSGLRGHVRDGSDSSLEEAPVRDSGDLAPHEPVVQSDNTTASTNESQDTAPSALTSSPDSSSSTTPSMPTSSPPTSVPTSPPSTAQSTQPTEVKLQQPITPVTPVTATSLAPASAAHSLPPTSFRAPVAAPFRPESRASSMVSFATAAETLPPSTPAPPSDSEESEDESGSESRHGGSGNRRHRADEESEESDFEEGNTLDALALGINTNVGGSIGRGKRGTLIVESPSTPIMKGLHTQEGTDVTITPGGPSSKAVSRQSTMSTMTVVPSSGTHS